MKNARVFAAASLFASVTIAGGCAKSETKATNSLATDTPVAAAATAEPAPPDSKIGKMSLLGQPSAGGECRDQKHEGLTTIVREVTYKGDYPERIMKVGVGKSGRDFLPINLEGRVHRETSPGREEFETIYVIFNPDGSVQSGRREYFVSDNSSPAERQGLLPGDEQAAKQLAESVLRQCPAT
ncbi:MAG TPA: hypothetical protein VIF32_07225 [Gemmatimonadaceae bacterium]